MSSQNYGSSNNNPNLARNPEVNNEETQSLRWDSAWQPDYDEDYGTPVQQYSGPGNFPTTPAIPPLQPLPTPTQSSQHRYAQAAQSLPLQDTYGNLPTGYQPAQTYIAPGYNNVPPNVQPSSYAPITIYSGDQPMPPLQKQGEYQDNQTYSGYAPPPQTYNGQPLPPNANPSTSRAPNWLVWLIVAIILFAAFSSFGWVIGWWPFWGVFLFWQMSNNGWHGRWGRGYGRHRRGRNRGSR